MRELADDGEAESAVQGGKLRRRVAQVLHAESRRDAVPRSQTDARQVLREVQRGGEEAVEDDRVGRQEELEGKDWEQSDPLSPAAAQQSEERGSLRKRAHLRMEMKRLIPPDET